MTQAIQIQTNFPKDVATGLTLPLSKSLDLRGLANHRALVALELEVLAKKMDRFGWERDRNSPAHDRMILDWMDMLQDYPMDEIRAACRNAVAENPNKMPNECHIAGQIMAARQRFVAARKRIAPTEQEAPRVVTDEERARRSAYAAELLHGVSKTFTGNRENEQ